MTDNSTTNNTNNIPQVSVNNFASSSSTSSGAQSISTTNPSLFTKQLAASVEDIIINYMNNLTPTSVSTLQTLVVYINFMGNYVLPKLISTQPELFKISELMAVLYQSNQNLAQAIESFNK